MTAPQQPVYIYGLSKSSCVRRVAAVCNELNVPYELKQTDFAAIKTPEFLETKHPFGQMPTFEDGRGGFVLYESRAIARYLVLKYGRETSLLPPQRDLEATAHFEAAASAEQANFDPYASGIAEERVLKPFLGQPTDEQRVEEMSAMLDVKLQGYERILSKHQYLAGDHVTLADLFHLPYGYELEDVCKLDIMQQQKYPNVARWWKDISSRPAWQAVKEGA